MAGPLTGNQEALAIKKCGTGAAGVWGTAVACGAGDGMLFLSGQALANSSSVVDESRGRSYAVDAASGPVDCKPTYKFNLRFAGFEILAAMLLGTAGTPAQQAATTAYLHSLRWNTDPYGLMLTIAKNLINYIEEVPTAKVSKITISGEVGPKPLAIDVEVVGINKEVASAVNTLVTFANVTIPTDADLYAVMFAQTVFRMNVQSGGALAGGDTIYPSKFSISIDRKMKGEYTGAYRTSGSVPQDLVDEPTPDGNPECKLTLEFPTHSAATYLTALQNDTRYKMDITSTGPLIASTYYYYHKWQFPHMKLATANPTDDNGRVKQPLEFELLGCITAPTGMTGITAPVAWDIMSKKSTNPLA
jgi:hypothetical protein